MVFSMINWWAVLVCVIFAFISGAVWYSPKTFFSAWWTAIGKESDPEGNGMTWVLLTISTVVQVSFAAAVITSLNVQTPGSGLLTGFFIWLGFVATSGLTNKLFAGQLKAWFIETANHLINFLVFGLIMGLWH
ncbi:MAG: DUF1761 domain-containing protein [Lentisphaeria bacterium]|nr:DUF1761 domain-containing protein [Candidatus Neomarinimicrobiota bacterium]MCF7843058.1 DUF1761 domain-containing protein [Lentisphaeria bacterium]